MPKCLNKGVEKYMGSDSFDMDATIACRFTFMAIIVRLKKTYKGFTRTSIWRTLTA